MPSPSSRKRKSSRRHIRWGRVISAILLLVSLVVLPLCHPYDMARRWWAANHQIEIVIPRDSIMQHAMYVDALFQRPRAHLVEYDAEGKPVHHRVLSVVSYKDAFPDLNDVQLATAQRLGIVHPINDRTQADSLKDELVYIGSSPYYDMRSMHYSIPYLVPRAERLLTEIARSFQDSLVSKGLPMHKIQVSSVLRTEDDVRRLRRGNSNASEQSCHRYGTTFDISYNYYTRVQNPDGPQLPEYSGLVLKQVLSEVLRDQRELGTCYVKHEARKPCFHITCR